LSPGQEVRSRQHPLCENVRRSPPRPLPLTVTVALGIAGVISATLAGCGGSTTTRADLVLRAVNTSAGRMVVTGGGLTVYIYLPDQTHPSVTTCTGDCANDWPPILENGPKPAVAGISKARIGTVGRPDGRRQLTLNGYPLYRFAADRLPGDIRGEAVGDTWFAVDPEGNFLSLPPAGFKPASSPVQGPVAVLATAAGQVVTDGHGQTLYVYKDDTATTSACTPAWCVQDWPPLSVARVPGAIAGIRAPLGVLDRPDGTIQLTLAGHPLYTFSGDERPGDLRGLGIGGDWYPISPAGAEVTTSTATPGVG
jgi:predicted lipoprotein with Yx(FWY)xxD motif